MEHDNGVRPHTSYAVKGTWYCVFFSRSAVPLDHIALHCIALSCAIVLRCIALHCIVAFQDTMEAWLCESAFFLRIRLCRRFININCVEKETRCSEKWSWMAWRAPEIIVCRNGKWHAIFLALSCDILLHCIASPFFGTAEWHVAWRAPEDSVCNMPICATAPMPPTSKTNAADLQTTSKINIFFHNFISFLFDFYTIFLPRGTLEVPLE